MAKINNRLEEIKYWNEKRKNSKPLKKTPIKKRVYKFKTLVRPIAKRSKKQSSREAAYNKLVSYMKTLPENQVCIGRFDGCTHQATECHHSKGRIGKYLLLAEWFKFLCHNCHVYVELHPKEAKEKGLSYSRLKED